MRYFSLSCSVCYLYLLGLDTHTTCKDENAEMVKQIVSIENCNFNIINILLICVSNS